ncbi:MAG: metalloregulator ArsR/SmtB family transcription factor [Acidobacteriota bacterium]
MSRNSRRAQASNAANDLPPLPAILGREDLLEEVVELLCGEDADPLLVLGDPGVGKTALTECALRKPAVVAAYPRRILVRCDGVRDAAGLPGAIARAMGHGLTGEPLQALMGLLSMEPTLLVLDDIENPIRGDDRAAVKEVLAALSGCSTMALVMGRLYDLPWRTRVQVGRLAPEAAAKLFHQLTDDRFSKDVYLDDVLHLTGGVPQVVQLLGLAASSRPTLRWLVDAGEAQRSGTSSRGSKMHELEASVALVLDDERLDDASRGLASILAILPDGVTDTDLDVLWPDSGRDSARKLVDVGLATPGDEAVRMPVSIRESVQSLRPPADAAVRRVVGHFLAVLREVGERSGAAGNMEMLERAKPKIGNIEACLHRALDAVDLEAEDALVDLEAEDALDVVGDGIYGYSLLVRFGSVGSPRVLLRAAEVAGGENPGIRASCLFRLGEIESERERLESAQAHVEEALALYRRCEYVVGEAYCLMRLGDLALRRAEPENAREHLEAALPLFRRLDDEKGEAHCLKSLGDLAFHESELEAARLRFEEALPLFRRSVGSRLGEASCLQSLGDLAFRRGESDAARAFFEKALTYHRGVGSIHGEAHCLWSLGGLALEHSHHEAARECFEEAMALFRKVGALQGQADCIQCLGDVAQREGPALAQRHWHRALELYETIQDSYSIGGTHHRLALAATKRDLRDRHAEAARKAWRSIDQRDLIKSLDRALADEALDVRSIESSPADALGRTFAALADPTRRAILARLSEGTAPASEIAEAFDLALPTLWKHLKVLERARLIERGADAQRRPCTLCAEPLHEVADWVERYREI